MYHLTYYLLGPLKSDVEFCEFCLLDQSGFKKKTKKHCLHYHLFTYLNLFQSWTILKSKELISPLYFLVNNISSIHKLWYNALYNLFLFRKQSWKWLDMPSLVVKTLTDSVSGQDGPCPGQHYTGRPKSVTGQSKTDQFSTSYICTVFSFWYHGFCIKMFSLLYRCIIYYALVYMIL